MPESLRKRAVLYLRLSLGQGEEISDSILRQRADLEELAQREGWEIDEARVLADDGISGRKARANAAEALRMIREREAEVLVVWKLDRWTRQGLSAIGDLMRALDETPGSLFVALRDGLRSDQAAFGIIAAVLSEVAKTEADNTALRVRSSIRSNRQAGRFVGGTVPFGYRSAERPAGGRTLVPHPPEVATIRKYADRLLAGESQASICDSLVADGTPTTRSAYRVADMKGLDPTGRDKGSWSYAGLAAVWTGDSLLGRISYSRTVDDGSGKPRKVWDTVRDEDGLPLQAYPPLLDASTVTRLRAILRDPKEQGRPIAPPRRTRKSRLLSGVIFCAECGQKLWVTTSGGRTVYTCARRSGRCTGPNMKVDNADRAVSETFLSIAGAWPEYEEVEEVSSPATVAALADVEHAIQASVSELASDDVDTAAVLLRVETLKGRRTELQAAPSSITVRAIPTGRTIADAWAASEDDLGERRRLLLLALDHVELTVTDSKGHTGYHPERISYFWNPEPEPELDAGRD